MSEVDVNSRRGWNWLYNQLNWAYGGMKNVFYGEFRKSIDEEQTYDDSCS